MIKDIKRELGSFGIEDEVRRISKSFVRNLEDIKVQRIKNGTDDRMVSDVRITEAMIKEPEFTMLKNKLINMPRNERLDRLKKRGQINPIIGIFIGFLIVIIVAFIFIIFSAVFTYGFGIVSNNLISIDTPNNPLNLSISDYSRDTFGELDKSFQQLKWLSFVLIFALLFGLLISCYLIRSHPAWFFVYFIFSSVLVLFSLFIAKAYENIIAQPGFLSEQLGSFLGASWLMLYLHVWVGTFAFIGAIILFGIQNKQGD